MNTITTLKNLTIVSIILIMVSCTKSSLPPEVELDMNIQIGDSKVYLNGKIENYTTNFQYLPVNNFIIFSFKDEVEEWLWNILRFTGLPLQVGRYEIMDDGMIHQYAITGFVQIYTEDLHGYSYKLINQNEGYFEIESLDTINQEVKGSFKAIFERTSKNGHADLGLPKILLFQGVFYEKYESL